ncbi:MAG: HlyC/CorC family transporter [Gemmatimonadetes bacterium]|nr:HlyC/CorC family transporter [Gemmatimonadota bacterium]
MTPLPLAIAALTVLLAMLSAVADGALQAIPADATPADPRARALLKRRDSVHRGLVFARRLLQLGAGAALAIPLAIADRALYPSVLIALGAGVVGVMVTESFALALGDVLAERALSSLEPFVAALEALSAPGIALSRWVDRSLLEILPPPPSDRESRDLKLEQFSEVVAAEAEVSGAEEEFLRRILSLRDSEVRDVMVPRIDIIGIAVDTPWSEVVDRVRSSEHSRLPVYGETIDDLLGILYAKDLLAPVVAGREPDGGWNKLIRGAIFIPATKRIDDQLREFRLTRTHISIVIDEFGGTAGLVTIEDVLEEIVGEIRDEYDEAEPEVRTEEGTRWWVPGRLSLDDLSELTGHRFERLEVATVGGLVVEALGRVPKAGDMIDIEGFRFVAEQVRRRAVARVFLERLAPVDTGEHEAGGG